MRGAAGGVGVGTHGQPGDSAALTQAGPGEGDRPGSTGSGSPMSCLSFCRALARRASAAVLLVATVVVLAHNPRPAVEPRAFASDVSWDAAWTSGAFVDAGATLYRHAPQHFLCRGGCPPVEVSDRVGQAVGIVCRRDT